MVALVRLAVTFEKTLEAAPPDLSDSDRLAWEIPRTSAVAGSVGLLLLALRAALLVRELRSLPRRA